jgi:hypothetical protein
MRGARDVVRVCDGMGEEPINSGLYDDSAFSIDPPTFIDRSETEVGAVEKYSSASVSNDSSHFLDVVS